MNAAYFIGKTFTMKYLFQRVIPKNSVNKSRAYLVSQSLFGGIICGGGGVYADINERREQRMKKLLIFFIKTHFTSNVFAEAYSEPCQTSKMDTFAKIVNSLKALIVFAKKLS